MRASLALDMVGMACWEHGRRSPEQSPMWRHWRNVANNWFEAADALRDQDASGAVPVDASDAGGSAAECAELAIELWLNRAFGESRLFVSFFS